MHRFLVAFPLGWLWLGSPHALAVPDLSVDGVSLGMSLNDARTPLGSSFILEQAADTNDKNSSIWTAHDTESAIGLYFINDHLIYAVYNITYNKEDNPSFSAYEDAIIRKYGPFSFGELGNQNDFGANITWVFNQTQLIPKEQLGHSALSVCSEEPKGLLLNSDGHNLMMPSSAPSGCFKYVHVSLVKDQNVLVAHTYVASIWDQKSMYDYLKDRAQREKDEQARAAAAAAAAAAANAPHL
jgi:hypothetical protein